MTFNRRGFIMKNIKNILLVIIVGMLPLVSACSQNKKNNAVQPNQPGWVTKFDSLEQQYTQIHQAYMQDSTQWSPQARQMFDQMQSMWAQMGTMKSQMMGQNGTRRGNGMMNGGGMMGGNQMGKGMMGRGMMNGQAMMRFHNKNQQMMSYSQGMQQMMQQSGNSHMASMYGQMASGMRQMMSQLPVDTTATASVPETSGSLPNGSLLFAANCGSCHGSKGSGMSGVFPPLNGSSIAQGDKSTLTKIILHGLQGPVTVSGRKYNGIMPSFVGTLNDAQIAAILTYVRSMPKNNTGSVSAGEVTKIRKETASHTHMWSPDELGLK